MHQNAQAATHTNAHTNAHTRVDKNAITLFCTFQAHDRLHKYTLMSTAACGKSEWGRE